MAPTGKHRGDNEHHPPSEEDVNTNNNMPQRKTICCAVSTALLMMTAPWSAAQAPATATATATAATEQPQPQPGGTADDEVRQVLVVGARAAERSAITRKKEAATAQDSIIADDVGSFPDRNVAEAVSRIAGVSLNRDEYGEGSSVSVRGNSNDLTRVELDGMAVTSAAGNSPTDNEPGRGTMLNDLPADLIASVDVVKGSTADMTEGSLGGGIIIKTRTGLDFKKQTIVLRTSAANSSVNDKWTPNLNLIFADKYLDGRLGVVANVSSSKARTESHSYTAFAATGSPLHQIDFDNSPEKTFSFQPNSLTPVGTLIDADTPLRSFPAAGGTVFNSLTPRELVTQAAGAQTKQDCYTRFPWYTTAQLGAISSAANRATAQSQRATELQTCLSQWNDAAPWTVRRRVSNNEQKRNAADLRFDFRVNRDLTVYAKFNRTLNHNEDNAGLFSQGSDVGFGTLGTHYTDVVTTQSGAPYRTTTRTVVPGSGYYLYPGTFSNKGTSGSTYQGVASGAVINVDPSTVKVDANHNLVGYRLSNAGYSIDTVQSIQDTKSTTAIAGGTYRSGGFRAEFLAGRTTSRYYRYAYRSNLYFSAGPADVAVDPTGIVTVTPLGSVNLLDPANYSVLAAPSTAAATLGQARNANAAISLDSNIKLNETAETTYKGDFTYALGDRVPFLNRVKFGFNARKQNATMWGQGGMTVATATPTSAAINVPNVRINTSLIACENTAASLAPGGVPCAYGIGAPSGVSLSQSSTVTQAQFNDYVAQSIGPSAIRFFDGMADKPSGLGTAWPVVDLKRLFALSRVPNLNPLDCIKQCLGSDGKVYDQPFNRTSEKTSAGYLSTDFVVDRVPFTSWRLPFGMEIDGNFGYRYVRAKVTGTASTTFSTVTPLDPANPDPQGEVVTTSIRRSADFQRTTTDIMPVLNLAWWVLPDQVVLRYNRAKTIARQRIAYIYGSNPNCTYDFRREAAVDLDEDDGGETDMNCSGIVGNPALRPYTNINHNVSAEWYVNNDTMLSASVFRQVGKIGAPRRVTVYNARPFEGTNETDPSGRPLSDIEFKYSSYINGPAVTRTGVELSGKTAFTFLPSVLQYTGASANYTRVRATSLEPNEIDFYTGEELPQRGVQKYSWNASLWYDDGALNMRAALQVVPATYSAMASNSTMSNYPNLSNTAIKAAPYDPSMAIYNSARRYLDVKIGYKFKNGVEVFAEGRNLGKRGTSSYLPTATLENGQPILNTLGYSGARYLVGAVVRY
jgi:TonB-dependent receptor